jgi:hypothetical protein
MSNQPLKKEFEYFLSHQTELVQKYDGKFIVIKNEGVVGSYDSESEAFEDSSKKYEPGTFLIQKCSPGAEVYSQTFHSRVML